MQSKPKPKGSFSKLFNRQRRKVGAKENVGKMFKGIADDDLKRIATLIQKWLQADENEKAKTALRRSGSTRKRH